MSKCKYCKKQIEDSCIRCFVCNRAWLEGRKEGIEELRHKLKETKRTFLRLVESPVDLL